MGKLEIKGSMIWSVRKYVLPLQRICENIAEIAQLVEHFIRNEKVRGFEPHLWLKEVE